MDVQARGFTLVEMMVVVAIIGIAAAIAAPAFSEMMANRRLKDAAVVLAGGFELAHSEAIRSGNVHIVFYQEDAQGNSLTDADGNAVPLLILDDGRPGSAGQNCRIDSGESIQTVTAVDGVSAGVFGSPGTAPSDLGSGTLSTGSTFTQPDGSDALWVMFRPEGNPLSFDAACAVGPLGSGAGAFYLHNGLRTAAVVLMPMGSTRVHSFAAGWST